MNTANTMHSNSTKIGSRQMQGYPFFLPSHADNSILSIKKKDIVDFDICIESFGLTQFFMSTRYNNVRPTKPGRNDRVLSYEMTVGQFIEAFIEAFIEVCNQGGLTNAQEHERFIRVSREFRYDPGAMEYNVRFNIVKETAKKLYNKEINAPENQALGYRKTDNRKTDSKTDIVAVFLDDDCMFWTLNRVDAVELIDSFILAMSDKYDAPVYDVLYTLKYYPKHAYCRMFYSHVAPTLLDRDKDCNHNREQFMKPLTMPQFFYSFASGMVPDEHLDMYKDCWHVALSEFCKDRR